MVAVELPGVTPSTSSRDGPLAFTGLVVGYAVTMKTGLAVAATEGVTVRDGYAVISKRGVDVRLGTAETEDVNVYVGVPDEVSVPVDDIVYVGVPVDDIVPVKEAVAVRLTEDVGGATVPLADAASLPTVMSTPHASGKVSVAE
jgi:hypothetical protein